MIKRMEMDWSRVWGSLVLCVVCVTLSVSAQPHRTTEAEILQARKELVALNSGTGTHWTTRGTIVGIWVKACTVEVDHYLDDANWTLEVTFRTNGTFVWQALRYIEVDDVATNRSVEIDESVTGTYTIERHLVTYQFDTPSGAAMKQLPNFFAFWPQQLRGQQTFRLGGPFLRLGNDAGKRWVYLKRKGVYPKKLSE